MNHLAMSGSKVRPQGRAPRRVTDEKICGGQVTQGVWRLGSPAPNSVILVVDPVAQPSTWITRQRGAGSYNGLPRRSDTGGENQA